MFFNRKCSRWLTQSKILFSFDLLQFIYCHVCDLFICVSNRLWVCMHVYVVIGLMTLIATMNIRRVCRSSVMVVFISMLRIMGKLLLQHFTCISYFLYRWQCMHPKSRNFMLLFDCAIDNSTRLRISIVYIIWVWIVTQICCKILRWCERSMQNWRCVVVVGWV